MIATPALEEGAQLLVQFIAMVVFGAICAAIAPGRGRSAVGWFFVGFLFSCLGLVVLLALPDLKKEEARHQRFENENRRLRELLTKNRQVSDQRHQGIERRLGAHDQALGVDTSSPDAQLAAGADRGAPPLPSSDPPRWFYAKGNDRHGPVTATAIRRLLEDGVIDQRSLVWADGMVDWQPLGRVDELRRDVG